MAELRPAVDADAAALAAINACASEYPWSQAMFADSIVNHRCWVLELDRQPVAGLVYSCVLDEVQLLNIFVSTIHQGRGLASRMMSFLREKNRPTAVKIFLEVRLSNIAAISLYGKWGFQVVSRRKAYYPASGGREDALIMVYDYGENRNAG
jgi:[ribosomal protein S18]-alanine N-acetyltransferase